MSRRPALKLVIFFSIGILLSSVIYSPWLFFLILSCLVGSLFLARFRDYLLILALILTGVVYSYNKSHLFPPNHIKNFTKKKLTIEGVIVKEPTRRTSIIIDSRTIYSGGKKYKSIGKTKIDMKKSSLEYRYGDRICVTGFLKEVKGRRNPGEFDYRTWLARRGIHTEMRLKSDRFITILSRDEGNPFIRYVILPLKNFIKQSFRSTLSGEVEAFLGGIMLGERENLRAETKEAFSKTGVYHILAISGLHVGVVAFIFFIFFRSVRLPFLPAVFCCITLLVIYAFITGLRPSVVRATIMSTVVLIGLVIERNIDLVNLISFAALIILLFNPHALFDVSFQLSFSATLSIVYFLSKVYKNPKSNSTHRYLISPFFVSIAAQLGTGPVVAYYFHLLPLLSIFINLLIIPMVTLSIALGFTTTATSLLSFKISTMFASANYLIIKFILNTVGFLSKLKFSHLSVPKPPFAFIISYYLLYILILNFKDSLRARKWLIIVLLVLPNYALWNRVFKPERLNVIVFSSRQNCVLIELPNKKRILLDGDRSIRPYFEEKGIKGLDALIMMAPYDNPDILFLLKNYRIEKVFDYGIPDNSKTYLEILRLIKEKEIEYRSVGELDKMEIHPVQIEFSKKMGINFRYREFKFLLSENKLFIPDSLSPEVIVTDEFKRGDVKESVQVYHTVRNGAVVIKTDGRDYLLHFE